MPSFTPNARAIGGTLIEPDSIRTITMTMTTPAIAPIERTSRAHARLPPKDQHTGRRTRQCCCGPLLGHLSARHSPRARAARAARDHAMQPALGGPARHHVSLARAALGRFAHLRCRPPTGPAAVGRRVPRRSAWRPSQFRARRTDCCARAPADHPSSSLSQPGAVTKFLLVMIDRREDPQLADDLLDGLPVALPHRLPSLGDQLGSTPDIGALSDASRATLEFPFPCPRMAEIRCQAQPLDDGALPLDLIGIPRHERALAGLVGFVQRRSLGVVAIARNPANRHCEAFLDLPSKLRPRLLGLDLGEQRVEVREYSACRLAGIEIAAACSLDVLLGLVQARHRSREAGRRLAGTVEKCGTREISRA